MKRPEFPIRFHALLSLTLLTLCLGAQTGFASDVDRSFGDDGLVRLDRPTYQEFASDLAVDSKGRIYIAFEVTLTGTAEYWPAVIRLLPDGLPDASFGSSGLWLETTYMLESYLSIAVDAADRLYVGWSHEFDSGGVLNEDWVVRRLKTDGTDDLLLTVGFDLGSSGEDTLVDLTFTPDGRLVGVGRAQFGPDDDDFAVAVWKPNGDSLELDPTFSSDGKRTVAIDLGGGKRDLASSVIVDSGGRLVIAGEAETDVGQAVAVCRLLLSGDLDTGFSGDGKAIGIFDPFDQPPWEQNVASDLAPAPGGGYYVSALIAPSVSELFRPAVLALSSSGSSVLSFGNFGWAVPSLPTPPGLSGPLNRLGSSLAVDDQSRILLAGAVSEFSFDHKSVGFLLRLTDRGALDAGLSGDGIEYYDFTPPGEPRETTFSRIRVVDSGRKLVVAGSASGIAVPAPANEHVDVIATRLHIQSDIFADGFEAGNLSAWSSSVP